MKHKAGISLIALVLTIIIFLLLAGILLMVTTQNGSIFSKTKQAKEEHELSAAQEALAIKLSDILTDQLGTKDLNSLNGMQINGYSTKVSDVGKIITMTKNNSSYSFFVDSDYQIHPLNTTSGSSSSFPIGTESSILEKVTMSYTIRSNKILLDISTQQQNSSAAKGYLVYCDHKLYGVINTNSITITGLTRNTTYSIYCIAFDEEGNYKKSEELKLTTVDAEYAPTNKYAILTDKGIMNLKYTNIDDENDFYYEFDLNIEESFLAKDAISKNAYDTDESTFFFGGNISDKYMDVAPSAWNKTLQLKSKGYQWLQFLDKDGNSLYSETFRSTDSTHSIPVNAVKMKYYFNENGGVYEMYVLP